jgi:transposase
MALTVRPLTEEERTEIQRRAQSRTEAARVVERARIIWLMHQGLRVPEVAQRLRVGADVVRQWVKRFNAAGLDGLRDRPRSGRPETYTPEQVGQVLATALTDPRTLGLPFSSWTLDRLSTYLHERSAEAGGPLPISRSQINRLLVGEGLRWRTQETWFGECQVAAGSAPPVRGQSAPGGWALRGSMGLRLKERWG